MVQTSKAVSKTLKCLLPSLPVSSGLGLLSKLPLLLVSGLSFQCCFSTHVQASTDSISLPFHHGGWLWLPVVHFACSRNNIISSNLGLFLSCLSLLLLKHHLHLNTLWLFLADFLSDLIRLSLLLSNDMAEDLLWWRAQVSRRAFSCRLLCLQYRHYRL